ncbi:MAG: FAD-binding oxidoreductase [Thermoleophilaceae bacterium]
MTERRWWGWAEGGPRLSDSRLAALAEELGGPGALTDSARVALEDVRLPEPAGGAELEAAVSSLVGAANVRSDRGARVSHALGKSYPDLVRIRAGDGSSAPDLVVLPGSAEEVTRVLELCAAEAVAVVPFGGGTSVVGGVEPLRSGFRAIITLDLGRLDGLTTDRRSLTATCGAGLPGARAENRLAARGLTLGHFPQSYELGTIGGYLATRSAGQASSGYGRVEDLVLGLDFRAPTGRIELRPVPASAAGPSLLDMLVGSEGTLGVICEATLAIRTRPAARRYEGWSFRTFEAGADAFRQLAQTGLAPDVARLSDREETRLALLLSASGSAFERLGKAYLRLRGHEAGCLVIVGFEGDTDDVERRARLAGSVLRSGGGLALGSRPGRSWLANRYAGPYLRDQLLDRSVMVETLETATTWTRLHELHSAVAAALRGTLGELRMPALVGCHISHLYPSGASLYFTYMASQDRAAPLEQWRAAKRAASEAIIAHGGTITHHHAVGRDHAPWMEAEVGAAGVEALRGVRERLDPGGIMNPGKLVPSP